MKPSLYRAVYCSRATISGAPAQVAHELQTVLDVSRRNNERVGLTGALLFANQCFAQALEGEREAIEACFERIQIDPRHSDVTVLEFQPVSARDFSAWSMAFTGDPAATHSHSSTSTTFKNAFGKNRADSGSAMLGLLRQLVRQEELWALA